jgi:hypothetical protein
MNGIADLDNFLLDKPNRGLYLAVTAIHFVISMCIVNYSNCLKYLLSTE